MVNYINDITAPPSISYPGSVGIRTDGLLGDNIVASTAYKGIINFHKNKHILIFSTYNHECKRVFLLLDLYQELIRAGLVVSIVHYPRPHGPISQKEKEYLFRIGCDVVYDCAPFQKEFLTLTKGEPFLGTELEKCWQRKKNRENIVGLFRWSGFHKHYPMRNRPYKEWKEIEYYLKNKGYQCILFGYDDPLPNSNSFLDYRKRLSIYDTLKTMSNCSLLISTTSFPPLFCQFYIPCLVLSDSEDIKNLKNKWEVNKNYRILDVSKNYIPYIDEYLESFSEKTNNRNVKI